MTSPNKTTTVDPREKRALFLSMGVYLDEIETICGRRIQREEILAAEAFGEIRQQSKALDACPLKRFTMPFAEKSRSSFQHYVESLERANASGVYVVTPRSAICGAYLTGSVATIEWKFPYELNKEGIAVFLTSDVQDRLLLDFSEESGQRVLEVEARGRNWSKVEGLERFRATPESSY